MIACLFCFLLFGKILVVVLAVGLDSQLRCMQLKCLVGFGVVRQINQIHKQQFTKLLLHPGHVKFDDVVKARSVSCIATMSPIYCRSTHTHAHTIYLLVHYCLASVSGGRRLLLLIFPLVFQLHHSVAMDTPWWHLTVNCMCLVELLITSCPTNCTGKMQGTLQI